MVMKISILLNKDNSAGFFLINKEEAPLID